MVDYQTISIVFTGLSISLAAFYYITTLRNAQRNQKQQLETRQAQLLMNIMNTFRSREFRKQWHTLFELETEGIESIYREYRSNLETITAWTSVLAFFDSIGVLVRYGMIEVGLIHSVMASSVMALWETFGDFVLLDRKDVSTYTLDSKPSRAWMDLEYLYQEIIEYNKTLN